MEGEQISSMFAEPYAERLTPEERRRLGAVASQLLGVEPPAEVPIYDRTVVEATSRVYNPESHRYEPLVNVRDPDRLPEAAREAIWEHEQVEVHFHNGLLRLTGPAIEELETTGFIPNVYETLQELAVSGNVLAHPETPNLIQTNEAQAALVFGIVTYLKKLEEESTKPAGEDLATLERLWRLGVRIEPILLQEGSETR
ncbi:hypothetical protein HYW32_01745 [Candidatus Berkelbacteria bacterium]|nr:hypothetical protein [Candidatus Berkelbacteria bacterium]